MHGLPELNRRQIIFGSVLIVASVVGLYFLIPRLAGLNQTWGQLKHGDPILLVVGGVLEMISVAGYAVMFKSVVGRGVARLDWRASVEIPLAGIAAIRLFSAAGAGGVAVTVWALRRAGMSASLIACRLVASYVIQYSIYLGALIVCGLGLWFGVFSGGGSFGITVIPAVLSAAGVALVLSMALVPADFERRLTRMAKRSGRIGRLAARLATAPATLGSGVRTAISVVRSRRYGPGAALGALAYWGFDIAVLGLSFKAFGQDLSVAVLVMGYFLGTLGSLLPLPGGIGGVEGGMIGAFAAFGVPGGRAVIGVLAYRAISFWIPTLPGIFGYIKLRSTVRGWRLEDGDHAEGDGLDAEREEDRPSERTRAGSEHAERAPQ
ncbi:MAG TPA: lysylphosphatidylglycerol synthase transmembrane domain-containing protein [Solirubrobacteraceae bacterium]|nr:lysylphosphatidylglycerol synthase transmembrane domain-containing protein [Solirubrobacteraceae bacterium]